MNTTPQVGIDIVSISRIEELLEEFPNRFRAFAFTKGEQSYCDKQPFPEQHYAARWAVKEAYLKAAPSSESNRALSDIEIIRGNKPHLQIKDSNLGILNIPGSISLAHERELDLAIGIVCIPNNILHQQKAETD